MGPNIDFTHFTQLGGGKKNKTTQHRAPGGGGSGIWEHVGNNYSFANTPFTRAEEDHKCLIKIAGLFRASQMFGRSSDY